LEEKSCIIKNSNPDKVKESWQKASETYRKSNPEKVKQSSKAATVTYRKSNPEKVKKSCIKATAIYQQSNPQAEFIIKTILKELKYSKKKIY
jgi:hypothetical protein